MRAVASSDETAANRILSISDPGRPPAYSVGHPSPGATAGSLRRFQADSPRGICAGCEEAGGRYVKYISRFAGLFTGATGLEPATSGVTGRLRAMTSHGKFRVFQPLYLYNRSAKRRRNPSECDECVTRAVLQNDQNPK
jgi:hypothetical protein